VEFILNSYPPIPLSETCLNNGNSMSKETRALSPSENLRVKSYPPLPSCFSLGFSPCLLKNLQNSRVKSDPPGSLYFFLSARIDSRMLSSCSRLGLIREFSSCTRLGLIRNSQLGLIREFSSCTRLGLIRDSRLGLIREFSSCTRLGLIRDSRLGLIREFSSCTRLGLI
jgi:hypothetical protein